MTAFPATPTHGGQLRQIAAYFGVKVEHLLDFSANINPAGPPALVLTAIQRALADPATLTAYPDLEMTELKAGIARCSGVEPSHISVGNGFVPLLDAALRSLNIVRCLLPVPCFSEYRRTLENAAVRVVPFQLSADRSFRYDPAALVQACLDQGCDAILLANPQNPSGVLCPAEQMKTLIDVAGRQKITVLLDEAFIDYCPDDSLAQAAANHPRLIVFRSVTKFFAIPGLRVAYAIGRASAAELLNRFLAPWPVTSLASDAVCAALRDDAYARQSRTENERQRCWLEQELERIQIATYPSRANFLLLRFPERVDVEEFLARLIVSRHIVLRSCVNFEGLSGGHLRVAVRSQMENERLIQALEQELELE